LSALPLQAAVARVSNRRLLYKSNFMIDQLIDLK